MKLLWTKLGPGLFNEELITCHLKPQTIPSFPPLPLPARPFDTMHRALDTYDVIENIVSWLPMSSLTATIRVNSQWFLASKRLIWDLVELHDALELLGPVEILSKIPHSSTAAIDISRWKRFDLYRRHVRVLIGNQRDSAAVLHVIRFHSELVKNPVEPRFLFPACRRLNWHAAGAQAEIQILRSLITPRVDFVQLVATSKMRRAWFSGFCKVLVEQLSFLKHLILHYNRRTTKLDHLAPFYALLERFAPTLFLVELSGALFTDTTIDRLSKAPDLRSITFGGAVPQYMVHHLVDRSSRGFQSLDHFLLLDSALPQLPVFKLFRQFSFTPLTCLHWQIKEVKIDLELFLKIIPTTCPNMEQMVIGDEQASKTYTVQWPIIRSLLNCKRLCVLGLRCLQVEMTLNNFDELLKLPIQNGRLKGWAALYVFSVEPLDLNEALVILAKNTTQIIGFGITIHVKEGVKLFSGTPATSLPLDLMEDAAEIRMCLETHSELTKTLRQDGIFFPCLIDIDFGDSSFIPDSAGAIASLLLAISDSPMCPRINGDRESEYLDRVLNHMARFYVERKKLTSQPFTQEVSVFMEEYYMYQQRRDSVDT